VGSGYLVDGGIAYEVAQILQNSIGEAWWLLAAAVKTAGGPQAPRGCPSAPPSSGAHANARTPELSH